jgi:hypothetical protein
MSTYTVKAVEGSREWESAYGQMISYQIALTGPDGESLSGVELSQKKTTAAPAAGQELTGTIDMSGKYGPKFKKEKPQFSGGGGGGRPQKDDAAIARAVAYKGAIELTCALIMQGHRKDLGGAVRGFFDEGLALLEDKPAPGPKPVPLKDRRPTSSAAASNGGVAPVDYAIDQMRDLYAEWHKRQPEAPTVWANKLVAMGIPDPQHASDEQLEELIAWLKEQA